MADETAVQGLLTPGSIETKRRDRKPKPISNAEIDKRAKEDREGMNDRMECRTDTSPELEKYRP